MHDESGPLPATPKPEPSAAETSPLDGLMGFLALPLAPLDAPGAPVVGEVPAEPTPADAVADPVADPVAPDPVTEPPVEAAPPGADPVAVPVDPPPAPVDPGPRAVNAARGAVARRRTAPRALVPTDAPPSVDAVAEVVVAEIAVAEVVVAEIAVAEVAVVETPLGPDVVATEIVEVIVIETPAGRVFTEIVVAEVVAVDTLIDADTLDEPAEATLADPATDAAALGPVDVDAPPPRSSHQPFAGRPFGQAVTGLFIALALVSVGLTARTAGGKEPQVAAVEADRVEVASAGAAIADAQAPRPVGAMLTSAPDRLELEALPPATVDRIRLHLEAGDVDRALRTAQDVVAKQPKGRERDAAWMAIGVLNKERDKHQLASEAFGQVKEGGGPLASLAAYEQAEQDQIRGENALAIKECGQVRAKWPGTVHAGDCNRIQALGYAALGNADSARAAAAAYDAEHSTGRIAEQITLTIAEHLVDEDPKAAIPLYAGLAVNHSAALAGRVAEERLAQLHAAGFAQAVIPSDLESRKLRAVSLREAGRRDAAWKEFDALRKVPAAAAWVEEETERFGWQTQRWDFLDAEYAAELAKTGDPEAAWKRYRVLARSSKFAEAADLGLQMQKKAGNEGHWRKSEDEVGRTLMLVRRYPEARAQFNVVAERGGWAGKRAAFSAAFASYMAGDLDDAIRRFGAIADSDEAHAPEAHYWRAAAYAKQGKTNQAEADKAWLTTNAPWSWYAALIQQQDGDRPTVEPYARVGRWIGTDAIPPVGPEVLQLPIVDPKTVALAAPVDAGAAGTPGGFAEWRAGTLVTRPDAGEMPIGVRTAWELEPPASYRATSLFDPPAGRVALAKFAEEYGKKWPELLACSNLASVGLYDLSGPILNDWFEAWRVAVRKRDATAKKLSNTAPEAWRQLFLAARDHNNTARNVWEMWANLTDPQQILESWRLAYPLAHDRYVWTHAREHDLDPYLVLGLMRQESTYNATARSRVGARGAMQIMPRTGHLLADLQHDTTFDAGDLEDPTVAVGYGIRYIGLLMDRFGGVFPLAVASYNSGPFNVSNWLRGTGRDMPIDEFVEHIPFRETRDYVKKVTEGYSAYISLYAPSGSALGIPLTVQGDRPEVVDF